MRKLLPLGVSAPNTSASDAPAALVLPLAALQALWQAHLQPTSGHVFAHAGLVLQGAGLQCFALAGPTITTPLADAWQAPTSLKNPRDGVCLMVLTDAPAQLSAPSLPTAEDWLNTHAPAWRLACRALRPVLVLLWLSRAGAVFLGWRNPHGEWAGVPRLELPGSGLRRVYMQRMPELVRSALPFSEHSADASTPGTPAPDQGRYSRPREALGDGVLHTLQTRTTTFIGLGRTGAPMVHSAVRLGMPVLGLDPDVVEAHNLDGEFSPLLEGWTKASALRKQLTSIARPGADVDLRSLDVASPAAGNLISACDGAIVTSVDNSRALLMSNAWALALNRVHIVVASGLGSPGGLAEAEIRVLLPGEGCVLCVGGLAEPLERVREQLLQPHAPRIVDFRQERPGSLRSWSVLAGHHALRALEQVAAGRIRHSLFRRLTEQADGGLQVQERHVLQPLGQPACPMCQALQGAGVRAVTAERLRHVLENLSTKQRDPMSENDGRAT